MSEKEQVVLAYFGGENDSIVAYLLVKKNGAALYRVETKDHCCEKKAFSEVQKYAEKHNFEIIYPQVV